jgi:hypothetical protein
LFALLAMALLITVSLGSKLLLCGRATARALPGRVTARREGRCELSVVSAIISLLREDKGLFAALSARTKLRLEVTLANS